MNCPKCNKSMKNHGNLSGMVMTSYPAQWDETYACDDCKVKKTVRVYDELPQATDLSDYINL